MDDLDNLDARYRAILCDIWGVVHDGGRILPGVEERLLRWKSEGRAVVLLTNAPRSADAVQRRLDELGLPRAAYDEISSSGEVGIDALTNPSRPVGFLGTTMDRADLVRRGVMLAEEDFAEFACTGLDEWRDDPAEYRSQLVEWAERGSVMHCLNPDRIVIHCGRREACAGALADIYEALAGTVEWYGKPHGPIYDHARALIGGLPREAMLAIGDGLQTDMLGAGRYGIDAIYVSHGIHAGEPVPDDFAARHGLGDWHPIMTVKGLA
ncbi:TIGR01459 family HAD-type hydrolase [Sphingomonas sp. G124]|uniref:TIGR01459 family HAD-type hydrolase n=1 Tax=Sphingomonas cremea TaxID=2904799 RepID=A0A9X1QHY4_9SPHN|nr:TIGR01459 family HAD-type hydrolase [Sphingomonas cremea]MCF2514048.1 TIGR01459 family HAD-type hydrolase [Sphingomonas cremea]